MKERERVVITGLITLLVILWLGFLFHRSPRFAGSAWGGLLAVLGALLMLVPAAYSIVKRIRPLKLALIRKVPMRTLLAWHIYAGTLGPILVLLHTGHKFDSPLGIGLTTMTLLVAVSGFVGRYLMNRFSQEIRQKKALLVGLEAQYATFRGQLTTHPEQAAALRPFSGIFTRLVASWFSPDAGPKPGGSASLRTLVRLSESIADLEFAIRTHEAFKRWFGRWLKWHIVISVVLYLLLGLHVWASIHFGLRWFEPNAGEHYRPLQTLSTTATAGSVPAGLEDDPVGAFEHFYSALVETHWRPGGRIHGISTTVFDYAALAQEVGQPGSNLSQALAALRQVRRTDLGGGDREKAFWLNVYNLTAMNLAAANYPIDSILNEKVNPSGNPWGLSSVTVGDRTFTLKQIEIEQLLDRFDDQRIVFAVSCATVSCPDRPREIFQAPVLDQQLDIMIRAFLANQDKGLCVDRDSRTLSLSWILQADARLFQGQGPGNRGLREFVRDLGPAADVAWIEEHWDTLEIRYLEHDWTLNDLALLDEAD